MKYKTLWSERDGSRASVSACEQRERADNGALATPHSFIFTTITKFNIKYHSYVLITTVHPCVFLFGAKRHRLRARATKGSVGENERTSIASVRAE